MTSRIGVSIRRMLQAPPAPEGVHFHLRDDGQPFVCDVPRCESPGLNLGEVSR
jgi:hypothetical protein